jgi:hypothetical protein
VREHALPGSRPSDGMTRGPADSAGRHRRCQRPERRASSTCRR